VLGTVIAGVGMSAGPGFYQRVTGETRFQALTDFLADDHRGLGSLRAMDVLWSAYRQGVVGWGTGISAFPSMHLAVSTLLTLAAFRLHRLLGWAFVAFTGAILFGSVHLGWHYAVDGYVSIVCTTLIWFAVGWAQRRREAQAPSGAAAPLPARA